MENNIHGKIYWTTDCFHMCITIFEVMDLSEVTYCEGTSGTLSLHRKKYVDVILCELLLLYMKIQLFTTMFVNSWSFDVTFSWRVMVVTLNESEMEPFSTSFAIFIDINVSVDLILAFFYLQYP